MLVKFENNFQIWESKMLNEVAHTKEMHNARNTFNTHTLACALHTVVYETTNQLANNKQHKNEKK